MSSDRSLVLFTKPPRPGRVKTRLVGAEAHALSSTQAAELHWAFVLDQLERLEERDFELSIAWDLEEGEIPPELGLKGFRQSGADLGQRLWNGLSGAARHARWVAAVGSDHPFLTLGAVNAAFRRLSAGSDVVLGPALDGGYYLVGVGADRLVARLFEEIPWSTDAVLARTLDRCRELDLVVELLPEGRDVDTPSDLAALAREIAAGYQGCPRSRTLLSTWGLLQ